MSAVTAAAMFAIIDLNLHLLVDNRAEHIFLIIYSWKHCNMWPHEEQVLQKLWQKESLDPGSIDVFLGRRHTWLFASPKQPVKATF